MTHFCSDYNLLLHLANTFFIVLRQQPVAQEGQTSYPHSKCCCIMATLGKRKRRLPDRQWYLAGRGRYLASKGKGVKAFDNMTTPTVFILMMRKKVVSQIVLLNQCVLRPKSRTAVGLTFICSFSRSTKPMTASRWSRCRSTLLEWKASMNFALPSSTWLFPKSLKNDERALRTFTQISVTSWNSFKQSNIFR